MYYHKEIAAIDGGKGDRDSNVPALNGDWDYFS